VIAIDSRTGWVTVSVTVGEEAIESKNAEMFVEPSARALASPVLLIVATVGLDELQVAHIVRFCELRSSNVPVAVNCCVKPLGNVTVGEVTKIECT